MNPYEVLGITENATDEDILDLVALGQIADASDISDYEIRSIIVKGLNATKLMINMNNPSKAQIAPKAAIYSPPMLIIIPT